MLRSVVVILFAACLTAARSPQHRVVNGKQVGEFVNGVVQNPGTFPYITFIRSSRDLFFRLNATIIVREIRAGRCAGTIIPSDAVLTAAHCVLGAKPENVTIIAGIVSLDHIEQSAQYRADRRIVIHEQNKGLWEYDIALVFTSLEFEFNNFVNKLNLAKPGDYKIGTTLTASGWGRNVNGSLTSWLNVANMTLVDNAVCKQYSPQDFSSLICAMDLAKTSKVCNGDSGGPLVKNNVLVGVLNGGIDIRYPGKPHNGSCDPNYPTAYTKVSNYWSWITTQLLWDTNYINRY